MKEVKVRRQELLKVLAENKNQHQKIFEEALAGYKDEVVRRLEAYLRDARKGKRIDQSFHLPVPVNQSHEYSRAIRMMEMSVDDEITLTTNEFDAYVMDRWHWKQNFLVANSTYSKLAQDTMLAQTDEG